MMIGNDTHVLTLDIHSYDKLWYIFKMLAVKNAKKLE